MFRLLALFPQLTIERKNVSRIYSFSRVTGTILAINENSTIWQSARGVTQLILAPTSYVVRTCNRKSQRSRLLSRTTEIFSAFPRVSFSSVGEHQNLQSENHSFRPFRESMGFFPHLPEPQRWKKKTEKNSRKQNVNSRSAAVEGTCCLKASSCTNFSLAFGQLALINW